MKLTQDQITKLIRHFLNTGLCIHCKLDNTDGYTCDMNCPNSFVATEKCAQKFDLTNNEMTQFVRIIVANEACNMCKFGILPTDSCAHNCDNEFEVRESFVDEFDRMMEKK